ncbi:MAG: hypothetical protein AB7O97_07625 [Planctomycetota bacterium]
MMKFVSIALPMLLVVASCSDEKPEDKPSKPGAAAHGHEGPHGGHLLEVGDHVAHLEVMHDEAAGKMTIYVLGSDAKSALTDAKAPQVKLSTDSGPKVLSTTAVSGAAGAFAVTDPALKAHGPEGRISIEIGGKTYNPALEHDHKDH